MMIGTTTGTQASPARPGLGNGEYVKGVIIGVEPGSAGHVYLVYREQVSRTGSFPLQSSDPAAVAARHAIGEPVYALALPGRHGAASTQIAFGDGPTYESR